MKTPANTHLRKKRKSKKMADKLFASIASSSDHKTKNEKYKQALDGFIAGQQVQELCAFVDHSM